MDGLRKGGRVAIPNGVQNAPKPARGVKCDYFNGDLDAKVIGRLEKRMQPRPFKVHVDQVFPLTQVAKAHRALEKHHLGKLALRIK